MKIGVDEQYVKISGNQFPVISNSCTTGHKLQGCTVELILANDWYYGANWAYVVLSRVKTMDGLFIHQHLSENLTKYEKPPAMKRMLASFAQKIAIQNLTEEEYDKIEATDYVAPPIPDLIMEANTAY